MSSFMSVSSPGEKFLRRLGEKILILGFFFLTSACTPKAGSDKSAAPTPADSAVHLAIWGNYISPELLQKFTAETGIKVSTSNYSSNEELLAKVQMGASGFDVAVPSDYMVGIMIKTNQLEKLDKVKIPNVKLIAAEFLAQSYDPTNDYSLPFTWTTSGIAVNRELYKGPMKSWKDLLDNPALAGKMALLDDSREAMAAALKMKGFSVNTTKPEELKAAAEVLKKVKPRVKMFTSDTIDILNNKEVAAAQSYSSDALQAARTSGHKIEFILPEEGGTRAIDNLVILKKSIHLENAFKLVNFLLSAEVDLDRTQKILNGPVLAQTKAKLPQDLQKNDALFPPAAALKKMESLRDLEKDNAQYEEIWTQIKSQ
jgi:spermidine/putrescine transport system substrate-binding protein